VNALELSFTVPGTPAPQGSKTPFGGEANPHIKSWRETVARAAHERWPVGPIFGPVKVVVVFVFPRPKAHFRTGQYADVLRPNAPEWHTSTPDLDKLQRGIGDALKAGGMLRDDSQIAAWDVRKVYGHRPAAQITVRGLDHEELDI
jgi:Holliday junction resolvase RusA-like endonuclease